MPAAAVALLKFPLVGVHMGGLVCAPGRFRSLPVAPGRSRHSSSRGVQLVKTTTAAGCGRLCFSCAGGRGEEVAFLTRSPNDANCYSARAPSRSRSSVLLCGEGDFSFARALASVGNPNMLERLTATSLEPVEDIEAQWGGLENLEALRKLTPFVEVFHGIDATALDVCFSKRRQWDVIVFMFPHIAGKGKISLNRRLLEGFFRASEKVLSPGGTVEVTLVAGQGGTAGDGSLQRDSGNSWQVATQACEAGLVLVDFAVFDSASWAKTGYQSRGNWRVEPYTSCLFSLNSFSCILEHFLVMKWDEFNGFWDERRLKVKLQM
mmetsp:Transcript_14027/g.33602  ORF Transcript_14027/g.33602 Transcript_14027/m.33602 type:complete len:321 (+) Transcript_14027:259-1221(+)